ncbi:hypothetical protein J7481_17980 [Labrenzia sp. R4_2]|uniref:hypothetical protein n=1 Tax=Labrenzia sp. R4_2 TaxID=2821107 RepID=UPI001ADCBEE0|nr:hypothetical protein [Labrenzia sp. R4_2]
MGKTARLEYLRRILPLGLAVLGIAGWFYFMTLLSSIMCLVAAAAIYLAPPRPQPASGAIRPVSRPSVLTLDLIGFGLGLVFLPLAVLGLASATGALAALALICLLPASMSLVFFTVSVRQETSWVRFFGNGFEFTQFGLRVRVPYTDLEKVSVKLWHASGAVAWFQSTIGSSGRKKAVLLNGEETTKTLVFRRNDGSTFTISSELIPDLQRVLIGMDRAEVDLPEGISEWQRKKIRRRREKMYRVEEPAPKSEQLDVARIAALIEHARRNA